MHTNVVNDSFINPELRSVELILQSADNLKCKFERGVNQSLLSLTCSKYGKNPGKQIKFIVLPFTLDLGDQIKEFYVTIRVLKSHETGNENKRAFTSVNACYISPLLKNLNLLQSSKNKVWPYAPQLLCNHHNPTGEPNFTSENPDFTDLTVSAIHFPHGYKHNRDPNNIYLQLSNNRTGTLQLWPQIVSIQVQFVPKMIGVTVEPVLVTGTLALSDNTHAMILIITPDVQSVVPVDIVCDIVVIINQTVIQSNGATYTFVEPSPNFSMSLPLNIMQGNYQGNTSEYTTSGSYQSQHQQQTQNIGTVMGMMNVLQSFVQVLSSIEEGSNYQVIIRNFLTRHANTRDLLGFNLAGHFKLRNWDSLVNVLKQNGIEPIIPVWANTSSELRLTHTPSSSITTSVSSGGGMSSGTTTQPLPKEEENADVRTNNIVETMKTKISEMQQPASRIDGMIERVYQKVKHAASIDRLPKPPTASSNDTMISQNVCNSLIPTANLASILDISKRHMDAKKAPYLKVKFIAYDQNASQNSPQTTTPKLKAALFIAKYIIEFDSETQLITSTDHEHKPNFHYQTFYNQDVAVFRQNEEIESFLKKFSDFNCSWNANMLYDEIKSNSAHYCMSFLKYANIWNANMPYAKFLTNLCERKPLNPMFLLHQDFFFMDSVPVSRYLESQDALTWHWAQAIKDHMKNSSDAPFFQYDFNKDNTISNAKDPKNRLYESMIAFTYFYTTCAINFLKTDEGTKFLRFWKYLLVTNFNELPQDVWRVLEPVTQKFNLTFQRQLYNIVFFLQYIKPTEQFEETRKQIESLVNTWEGNSIQQAVVL
ncbi:hypothetical protein C9374_004741 [Naegleria lovaniensis]|uniref:Uncharacterized protein n=1 Tax=Naegleria lovaniensis TaxID=51637 RepID=A0AA88KIF8_NAELO|nr:uncharacterized protein C9374_004741 [Naegleria lovaniensis]KAG2382774.1 hypothetical protein C9374_004741 [Naegleria lovaniensis]